MTDRFTHDAGSYVLGALSPEDRRAFEEHLAGCAECREAVQEFAGLPGLLSRLPADELPEEGTAAPPETLLPALLRRARLERRSRRRRAVLAGMAAAFVAAAGSAALTEGLVDGPAAVSAHAVAFTRVSSTIPASAEAALTDVPGGTRIDMTCRYEGTLDGGEREYRLRVVPRGGPPEWLGSWPVLTGDDYQLVVVAPVPRSDIDLLEVVNRTGSTLLTLRP